MTSKPSNDCSTARQQLSTNPDGTHWEHFFIENQYSFSNQIPNRQSFTSANPGQVFYDRGLCRWGTDNPSDMAITNNAATTESGLGGAGLLLLIGIAAAGVYAWRCSKQDEHTSDYHPMADVPDLPAVEYDQTAAAAAAAATTAPTAAAAADTTAPTDTAADCQQQAQSSEGNGFEAPWDEPQPTVADDATTENSDGVQTTEALPKPGLDKLSGVSLKAFKEQLTRYGITAESGEFKSVELLNFEGTEKILAARMFKFWKEFSSYRKPHAIYFVFGLQDGGGRSAAFKQKYTLAKEWVENWYRENLPNEK